MGDYTGKLWYTHTPEYYSAVKTDGILIYATKWINLENVLLSESQMKNSTFLSCEKKSRIVKGIEIARGLMDSRS